MGPARGRAGNHVAGSNLRGSLQDHLPASSPSFAGGHGGIRHAEGFSQENDTQGQGHELGDGGPATHQGEVPVWDSDQATGGSTTSWRQTETMRL